MVPTLCSTLLQSCRQELAARQASNTNGPLYKLNDSAPFTGAIATQKQDDPKGMFPTQSWDSTSHNICLAYSSLTHLRRFFVGNQKLRADSHPPCLTFIFCSSLTPHHTLDNNGGQSTNNNYSTYNLCHKTIAMQRCICFNFEQPLKSLCNQTLGR